MFTSQHQQPHGTVAACPYQAKFRSDQSCGGNYIFITIITAPVVASGRVVSFILVENKLYGCARSEKNYNFRAPPRKPQANHVRREGGAAIKQSQWLWTDVHTAPHPHTTHPHLVQSPPTGCNLCQHPTWGVRHPKHVTGINMRSICWLFTYISRQRRTHDPQVSHFTGSFFELLIKIAFFCLVYHVFNSQPSNRNDCCS